MKNLISTFILVCLTLQLSYSQDRGKENFNVRMNNHVKKALSDPENMANAKTLYGHTCDIHHTVTADEIAAMATDDAKTKFIHANMEEYMNLYLGGIKNRSQITTVNICDNGGFEQDFLNYQGFVGLFDNGSKLCSPTSSNLPTAFTPVVTPVLHRFEIVTPGNDNLIPSIGKVKFGNKALKINSEIPHNSVCTPNRGVDKIKKEFTVSQGNTKLTVWWSTVMQKPPNHSDATSFINIKCDLAPTYDLCFDADFLNNDFYPSSTTCSVNYYPLVYSAWRCHTMYIPEDQIGQVATLEITMSDCAYGGHFGYAYIDGICEPCENNTMGRNEIDTLAINNYSCDGKTVTICGNYILPDFCPDCIVSLLDVPGYTIQNLHIDEISKSYCFDFSVANFSSENCINIFSEITFSKNGQSLPPLRSDEVEICPSQFAAYNYSVQVESCNNNASVENISDDYYFVTVNVSDPVGNGWIMKRRLINSYPGEAGLYTWATGSGNAIVELGPFLIQEGCWELLIELPGCLFSEFICPPPFCSGCQLFKDLVIGGVECTPGGKWSFNMSVPGTINQQYTISSPSIPNNLQEYFGTVLTIDNLGIGGKCYDFEISFETNCKTKFTVCPPKNCPEKVDCDMEFVVLDQQCIDNKTGEYVVYLDVFNIGSNMVCYKTSPSSFTAGTSFTPLPLNGQLGPFIGDVTVTLCSAPTCEECKDCNKTFRLFQPDCSQPYFGGGLQRLSNSTDYIQLSGLTLRPNPIVSGEMEFISTYPNLNMGIYNSQGNLIHKSKMEGSIYRWNVNHLSPGIYIVKYATPEGIINTIKFLKL